MLISGREAAARLASIGMPRRQANLALGAGLAGWGMRTPSAVLYEGDRVDALVRRPTVEPDAVARHCPEGLFLDRRVTDVRRFDPLGVAAVDELRLGWLNGALLAVSVDLNGSLPYVATVCGFVVLGAEITGVRSGVPGHFSLELTEPGAWFEAWRGRRWPTGPGREWSLLGRAAGPGVAVGG